MIWYIIAIHAVGLGLLAFALQPWLTHAIVRLAARIDADHPNEADDLYAEYMAGIDAPPVSIWGFLTTCGLLFKVAIARRLRDSSLAVRCAIHLRVGLVRDAVARRRATPRALTSVPAPAITADPAEEASSQVVFDPILLYGVVGAVAAIEQFYTRAPTWAADSDDGDGHSTPGPPQSANPDDDR